MGDFFHGWQKKIGVMTLVMACVLMAGWVRSLSDTDMSEFYSGRNRTELVCSFDCSFVWIRFQDEESHDVMSFPDWETTPKTIYNYFDDPKFNWTWQWAGFGIGRVRNVETALWIVPYWSIVIPLALLSAYLLLTKPRPSTPKKLDEPTTFDGQ